MNDTLVRPPTFLFKAILLIILASLANALMAFFVKLVANHLPLVAILFARFFITLILLLIISFFFSKKSAAKKINLKTQRLPLHLFRDVMGIFSIWSYFYATHYLSLANATVLFSAAPLFIPLVTYFWQRIKVINRLWWGMGIGFFGVVVLLHPGKDIISWPAIIGLSSGISAAISIVASRLLLYTESPESNMFYYFFVGTIISFLLLFTHSSDQLLWHGLTLLNLTYLLLVGLSGYVYQNFLMISIRYAPVRLTSPFLFTTTIFGVLIDWLVWHDMPSLSEWFGITLIILGGTLMVLLYPHNQDYHKKDE